MPNRKPRRVAIMRGASIEQEVIEHDVAGYLPASINAANDEAARIKAEQERGFKVGFDRGRDEGYKEVVAQNREWVKRCQAAVEAIEAAAADLRSREESALHHVADQTAMLSLLIAEQILQRDVALQANPGLDAIKRILGDLPDDGPLQIHLSPDDIETLDDVQNLFVGREFTVLPDAAVESGSALVRSNATTIDGNIATALERARQQLR
ncbi:FliH/SctL family protein [Stomatohabitans albus]|uniref:FliH/SctL family protein n=1 Tax=Stomatohabitans albus TaxID=3110766 RepID=UPI00300C3673